MSSATPPPRAAALDGLRGWSVLAIMLHHYWPAVTFKLPIAGVAMQAFFMLSGFLITEQLLRARSSISSGTRVTAIFKRFYWRRTLRLAPLFYVVLIVLWIVNAQGIRATVWWHAAYLTNIYVIHVGDWPMWVAHFWSLAVEQQFYLAWPLLILLAPRAALVPALLTGLATGPIFRYLAAVNNVDWLAIYVLPFGYLDSLALGGLLAAFSSATFRHERGLRLITRAGATLGLLGVIVSCAQLYFGWNIPGDAWPVAAQTLWALWMAWLVDRGWHNRDGVFMRVLLTSRAILYLGSISYGMYILHPIMPGLLDAGLGLLNAPGLRDDTAALFFTSALATIALAAVSWHWLERPVSRLGSSIGAAPVAHVVPQRTA